MRLVPARTRRAAWLIGCALVLGAGYWSIRPYLRATSFIIRAAGVRGAAGAWARYDLLPVQEELISLPGRRGPVRARAYRPLRPRSRTVLVFAGVHPAGIDEPRLVALSRELSQTGLFVVTPELPDLVHLEITPATVDVIEDATRDVAENASLASDGRVGVMGISFSGALAIVAAGRPSVRDRVAFVFSFGGHGDLPRVLRYLCTGMEPLEPDAPPGAPSVVRPPHDYGVAIVLYGMAGAMVPAGQVDGLRRTIAEFVWASHLDTVDKPAAEKAFREARDLADTMPDPARTLIEYANDRNTGRLGAALLPRLDGFGTDPSLSPERSPAPAAPVFLLHGAEDNVIPAEESVRLDRYLRGHGVRTRVLLSTLISHAEVDRPPSLREVYDLVRFWGDMLKR